MAASQLHNLIERLASLFRADLRQVATAHGLKLIQLEVLVYLATANRYSDTPAALTEYFGLTKGTVSQTLKALDAAELLRKVADAADARVVHCALTATGRAVAADAHPAPLLRRLGEPTLTTQTTETLQTLLRGLQRANGKRTFGMCKQCRFFEPRARGGRCGLTAETLAPRETTLICREHEALP